MITVLGVLIGALAVGLIWNIWWSSNEIARIKGDLYKKAHGSFGHPSYVSYHQMNEEDRLDRKIAQARDVIRELDQKIEEGLLLIENYDKRGIDERKEEQVDDHGLGQMDE